MCSLSLSLSRSLSRSLPTLPRPLDPATELVSSVGLRLRWRGGGGGDRSGRLRLGLRLRRRDERGGVSRSGRSRLVRSFSSSCLWRRTAAGERRAGAVAGPPPGAPAHHRRPSDAGGREPHQTQTLTEAEHTAGGAEQSAADAPQITSPTPLHTGGSHEETVRKRAC